MMSKEDRLGSGGDGGSVGRRRGPDPIDTVHPSPLGETASESPASAVR